MGERERERGESGEGAGVSQVKVSLLGAKASLGRLRPFK